MFVIKNIDKFFKKVRNNLSDNQKYTKIKDDFFTKVGKTMLIFKIR